MKILIVGGVAGGAGAAARLRRNDENAQIIMFEKGPYISFANCGLPYYIGGVIEDKGALQLQTPQSFGARFNVDVRVQSEVVAINATDKNVTVKNLESGETYTETYDSLVLSPGAKPIRPNFPGVDQDHIFTLRNIPDTYRIKDFIETRQPKTAVIVGGGYIGVEMAENLHHAGIKVSIVEAQDHVIASLDSEMASFVHNEIRHHEVDLYLQSKMVSIKPESVELESGFEVPADLVILSIGVQPETGFIRDSLIELGERGEILVDEGLRTNIPDVYALGDAAVVKNFITGKKVLIPLASPANKQARIVADVICGKKVNYGGTQGTAIAKVFGMTVAVTGENEASLKRNGIKYHKTYTFSNSNAGYYPGGKTMTIKLLFSEDGLILGAQIVGAKGVDKRMDVIATAIRGKMTVYDLQELELSYAPPFSSAKDPVNMAGYVASNILDGMAQPFYLEDLEGIGAGDILLDVRTRGEFNAGHLQEALNIPVDSLRQRLEELDKDKKIYIYCGIGLRGHVAQQILKQKGFDTLNLSGGYSLWKAVDNDRKAQAAAAEQCSHCGKPI